MAHLGSADPPNEWPVEHPGGRTRVLVALTAVGVPIAAIELGRVVARALAGSLHGVLVWPTAISPTDIPRILRIDPKALEGMVLDVEVGDPAERLDALARSRPAAFVVIPAEEQGPDICGLGDIALRTLAKMSSSAIIVRPGATCKEIRRILVPLDGTPGTAAALGPASELAQRAGASLDLVLVEDVSAPPPAEPGAIAPPRYVDQPQHEWPAFSREFIQRFLGSIGHRLAGMPVRFFLGAGRPAAEILRFAGELQPDLLTLVWQAEFPGEPGTVTCEVLRGARQPVLLLRRGPAST